MSLIYFPQVFETILLVIPLIVVSLFTDSKGQQIIIEESPLPLLIPTGEIATFSCRARCSHCRGFWIINGIPSEAGRSELERQGYTFTDSLSSGTNQHAMTVTITASESVNDSSILCRYCPTADHAVNSCTNSMDVTLLVIAGSPITPNPTIQMNVTHITLLWSPPFLWPNKRIHHYSVSLINKWQSKINSYWVNNSYSNRIVSFTKRIDNDERSTLVACSEMIILSIFAVGVNASEELQTFNATASELIIPSNFTRSLSPMVRITNIRIYLTAKGKLSLTEAYLQVYIVQLAIVFSFLLLSIIFMIVQLPICQFNYTLSLLDENGSVLMEADRIKQRGLRVVNEFIKSNLQVNHSYSLKVTTNIYDSQNVQTSVQYFFNTSHVKDHSKPCNATEKVMILTRQAKNIISYQIAVIVFCLFITALLFVSLICVIVRVYWSYRRKKMCLGSRGRVLNATMVDNPIYVSDGPMYESILTQPKRIKLAGDEFKQMDTCVANPHYESMHTPNGEMAADTARYIGQPHQPQRESSSQCRISCSASQSENDSIKRPRSKSASVSATAAMGLKCNGQPRNKLGLTLSLAGSGVTYNCSPGDLSLSNKTQGNISSEEEAYAVMNPAGSLFRSFTTGCDKEISKEFGCQEDIESTKI